MTKHLKRVPASFDDPPAEETVAEQPEAKTDEPAAAEKPGKDSSSTKADS
jgi:hypothetical protein